MARIGLTTEEDIKKMHQTIYNAENNIKTEKQGKSGRRRVVDFVVMSVLVVLCVFFVMRASAEKAAGRPVTIFGVNIYVVETESMVPTLNVNAVFVARSVDSGTTISVGDIITFKNPNNQRVTHRVVEIVVEDGEVKYKTKGDNPINSVDPWSTAKSDIEAVFWFKLPTFGSLLEGD